MVAHCSFFRSSTAFPTVRAPYCSADGSTLLILSIVNGFSDGSRTVLLGGWQRVTCTFARQRLSRRRRAVLLRGWQRITHTSARQPLSGRFAPRIAQRMAADCSYLRSSTAFTTVRAPYCSADVSRLLIPPLVNVFPDGSCAVLLSGWRLIAHSFSRQRLSRRFARRIAQRMAAYCSFFRSSPAFPTVRAPYCSAVGSALLIPPLVNGISASSRAVLLSQWQRIAHSFSRQRLFGRFARRIAPRMAAHCSFFRSSTAFPTVRVPYCSADGSALLILSVVNGFSDGSRTVLLGGWQRIARTFARQRLSRRMRAVLLRGWQRIAHTSACQWLSRPFARRKAQRMASDCSFFRSSTSFAVCAPFCTANGSGFLLLAVVNGFQYSVHAVLHSGWQRIAQRMAADSSFFRSSTPFIVRALFYSPDDSALLILPFVNGFHDGLRAVLLRGW